MSFFKKLAKAVTQPIKSTLIGARKDLQAVGKFLEGDFKGAGQEFVSGRKEVAKGGAGTMAPAASLYTPKLIDTVGKVSESLNAYATGDWNRASQRAEDLTGFDIDNSIAEAREKEAMAAYQAEIDAANEAEARNRRANLLSLRKSLTPSLSRSAQGGQSSSATQTIKGTGGIVLG